MATTVDQVLGNLEKWTTTEPEEEGDDSDGYIYVISEDEVTEYITKGQIQAAGYIGIRDVSKLSSNAMIDEAVGLWAAGLLWNKKLYDDAPSDAGNTIRETYGDKKIKEAKAILDGYIGDEDNDGRSDELVIGSTFILD